MLRRMRWLLGFFIASLVLSGLTAFVLLTELRFLTTLLGNNQTPFAHWIRFIQLGLESTYSHFPFFAYGTDWLAFAHIVIAIFFVPAYRNPVRNQQLIESGIIACILVIPTAIICGSLREIPFFWQVLDCSFGIFGLIPLLLCKKYIRQMKRCQFASQTD